MSNYDAVVDGIRQCLGRPDLAGALTSAAREPLDISWTLQAAQEAIRRIESAMTLPSVLMKPSLTLEGDKWCALYGDDLQSGVAGFGESPASAMSAFDEAWYARLNPNLYLNTDDPFYHM